MSDAAAEPALPEFGPLLPALVATAVATAPFEPALAPARLALATTIIEAAARARGALATGAVTVARGELGRTAWESAWQAARESAAAAVLTAARARLQHAALRPRMPTRRLAPLLPGPEQQAATALRLGAPSVSLFQQLDRLDRVDPSDAHAWLVEIERTARRLDEAWRLLERAAEAETDAWRAAADAVAAWRPSPWPFRIGSAVLVTACLVVGLMLGGWIDVPPTLRPLAERIWGLR